MSGTLPPLPPDEGAETLIDALPLRPSLVAVICAVPATKVVTTPVLETVATLGAELVHAMVRPVRMLPAASRNVAVACVVRPATRLVLARLTVTLATGAGAGALTVSVAEPVRPSLVAVICAVPAAIDVTMPLLETVATLVFELVHAMLRPVSTLPDASRVVAVACVDWPAVSVLLASETETDATDTWLTATEALPLCPSLVAMICAVPAPTDVTTPLLATVATFGAELVQTT